MLTINKIFPQEKIPEKTESFLFFDIETTGFSRDNTILYLIGCGYFEEGFQFIQWFNDDGTSEEDSPCLSKYFIKKRLAACHI